jgi:hypothetical protein
MPESLLHSIAGEVINATAKEGSALVKPLQEAVDFGDIDELALEERSTKRAVPSTPITTKVSKLERQSPDPVTLSRESGPKTDVREIFPWFEKNKVLPFSELFAPLAGDDNYNNHGRKLRPLKRTWNFFIY